MLTPTVKLYLNCVEYCFIRQIKTIIISMFLLMEMKGFLGEALFPSIIMMNYFSMGICPVIKRTRGNSL